MPRAAPDFAFVDQFGNERRLASLQGRRVLLHAFYGTCLAVCPVVIEQLREIYSDLSAEQRRELVILSISVDSVRDTTERLAELWCEGAHSKAGSWRNLRTVRSNVWCRNSAFGSFPRLTGPSITRPICL